MILNEYLILSSLSLAAAVSVFGAGKWYQASIPRVSYVEATAVSAEDFVSCMGKVERTGSSNVSVDRAGIASSISVSPGDVVREGQTLGQVTTMPAGSSQQDAVAAYASLMSGETPDISLETNDLISPIDGTVTSVAIEPESYVRAGQTAVVISSGNGLQLRLTVGESQISDLRVGQRAEITGVGFRDSVYYGTITEIADEATQTISGTSQETVVEVIASVEAPGDDIKPGFSVKARIVTQEKENVLIAPYETVGADENGNEYVFLYWDGKAVKTAVETGEEYDSGFEILSGIQEGDRLLYQPEQLSDGSRVILAAKEGES